MTMIFDGHAYCFSDQRGSAGWADRTEMLRHRQLITARHHMPAWRVGDRAEADSGALADLSKGRTFEALKDVPFDAGEFGRFEWVAEGERYAKQLYPPSIVDMAYPAERLVAEMDFAGVDMALLHRAYYQGIGNDFHADCVRRFPERLQALAYVPEWRVAGDVKGSAAVVERAVREQGLHGLHWLPESLDLYGLHGAWDGEEFRRFWDIFAGLGVPVFFTLNPRGEPRLESYLEELRTLRRWMERYRGVTVLLTHGLQWRMFRRGEGISIPEEVFAAAPVEMPEFHLQVMFPIALGDVWDYPMAQARPVLELLVERIGAERLIWGTDMPLVMRHWTYRQNLDYIRKYWGFLSEGEMDAVLGGNMGRVMGVGV